METIEHNTFNCYTKEGHDFFLHEVQATQNISPIRTQDFKVVLLICRRCAFTFSLDIEHGQWTPVPMNFSEKKTK